MTFQTFSDGQVACGGRATDAGGIALFFDVSFPDASGERTVTMTQGEHDGGGKAKKDEILPYMNNTDLSGGDYNTTHLPAGTDPHQCAALCMQDPKCMVWVWVIRGMPAGSGDCIFKTGDHGCPSPSPRSKTQGLCTAGRGHEPVGHKCKPSVTPPARKGVMPPVRILKGETLDVRSTRKTTRRFE